MAALFWMSGRTSLPFETQIPMPKGPFGNLMHVAAFAILGVFLACAFDRNGARPRFSEGLFVGSEEDPQGEIAGAGEADLGVPD